MDYERIQKPFPQGGGLSPRKLRTMLLGVEKKRKEEEELEAAMEINSRGGGFGRGVDDFKDVECSTSTETGSSNSRVRAQEEDCFDSESAVSGFEFQRGHRLAVVPPFSKPAPSKWDDAQKWIASPTSNRSGKGVGGVQGRRMGVVGHGSRQSSMKVVVEDVEEVETKRVDPNQTKREVEGQKGGNWVLEACPVGESCAKAAIIVEDAIAESAISLNRHDSSTAIQSATTFITPEATARSVSMRDMGTEMTPIASQEPSRTGTPVRAATPTRTPSSSRPSTPQRGAPSSTATVSAGCLRDHCEGLSEKELQRKTRREIQALGTQLGKMNIAAWASKEEEEKDASIQLRAVPGAQPVSVIQIRAAAWEEAEKAKYLARFKQEEIKIQAWENHQNAKAEAEMRKTEVEVQRMKAHAHDKFMNKLAAARHKAEEKRAAAEVKRNQQAARTAQQAEYIRRTGHVPSSFSTCSWCS